MTTTASLVLAAQLDPNDVTPGLLGFLVVFAMGVATWLLLRSMNRQLAKVDVDAHERKHPPAPPAPPVSSAPSAFPSSAPAAPPAPAPPPAAPPPPAPPPARDHEESAGRSSRDPS